eukprot:4178075-Amphidinium_carterae.1
MSIAARGRLASTVEGCICWYDNVRAWDLYDEGSAEERESHQRQGLGSKRQHGILISSTTTGAP